MDEYRYQPGHPNPHYRVMPSPYTHRERVDVSVMPVGQFTALGRSDMPEDDNF